MRKGPSVRNDRPERERERDRVRKRARERESKAREACTASGDTLR